MRLRHQLIQFGMGLVVLVAIGGVLEIRAPAADDPPGRKLAFLVGVKDYDHSLLNPLQYPENDVAELAEILRAQRFQVVLLTTAEGKKNPRFRPTAENIQRELAHLVKKVTRRDLIVVGLAGHGIQPLGSDRAYFCPQDGNPTTKTAREKDAPNVAAFPDTLVSIDELLDTLGNSGIGQTVMMVDACRNDPGVRGRRGVDRVRVQALPSETVVLLSCSPGQFAFEHKDWGKGGHGAFFSQVIEGLGGVAADDSGRVTWDDLARHLRKRVPALVKEAYGKDGGEQRPNIITNTSTEPLALAMIAGRRPPELVTLPKPVEPLSTPPSPEKPLEPKIRAAADEQNSLGMKFRLIPAGTFLMGSPETDKFHESNERQHSVTISKPFYLGQFEVTRGQFRKFVAQANYQTESEQDGEGGFGFKSDVRKLGGRDPRFSWKNTGFDQDDTHPVVNVTWADATQFCKWLSELEGKTYRLPTEAEWEYACRVRGTTSFQNGNDVEKLVQIGNVLDGSVRKIFPSWAPIESEDHYTFTAPVGQFQPNEFGLYDMHGNVWEWCQDWYELNYAADPLANKPRVDTTESFRVRKGGSWSSPPTQCRSAYRSRYPQSSRYCNLGFRIALNK